LDSVTDKNIKALLVTLLNTNEELRKKVEEQSKEIQLLKDEINRLKGEQGKPKIKGRIKCNDKIISSEKERKQIKVWKKCGKKDKIIIDEEQKCKTTREELPADAYLLKQEEYIHQDLKLVRKNTRYIINVYYSPSQQKTYRSFLPETIGKGHYGTNLKTLVHVLTHVCDVTQSKLLSLLRTSGIEISVGSLNNILVEQESMYESEKKEILQAGLLKKYCGMDSTCSKQKGQRLYTQIINNCFFSVFSSRKSKSRLSVLSALQGVKEPFLPMCFNEKAKGLLDDFSLSKNDKQAIESLLEYDKVYTKEEIVELIATHIPTLKAKKNMFVRLLESLAIGYYHQQTHYPVVKNLITDDAGEYKKIAKENHALCWVHDGRFYTKLTPYIDAHREILKEFKGRYWGYYHKLLDYTKNPDKETAKYLNKEFDEIFTEKTDYFQLNQCIERTFKNKSNLLVVLENPFIPLHNNASELGARRVVIKRKINLHTTSASGTKIKDAAMSVVETAKKLKVNVIDYLHDRISNLYEMESLADRILFHSG
jgi:hypothetical protein